MDATASQQFGVMQKQLIDHMQSNQTRHKSELNAIVQRLDEIDRRLERLEREAVNVHD